MLFCNLCKVDRSTQVVHALAECCIFHKQKAFGEWSDDDSDDDCKDCNPSVNDAKSGESDSS